VKKKILVIDDEEAVRKSFALALEDLPYQVDCVENGKVGVERFSQEHYDLVYLDLKMPEMNGVETLRAIRKQDKDVPVYIVTAFHKEYFQDLVAIKKTQRLDFELLMKPVGRRQIIMVTRGILEGAEVLEEDLDV